MANSAQEVEILQELDILDNADQQSTDCHYVSQKINIDSKLLNIIHFNIRSLKKNFDQLLVFLQTYDLLSCDIIVLSETWQLVSNDFNIDGYKMYYNEGDCNQNDGVVVYINSKLNIKKVDNVKWDKAGITIVRIVLSVRDIQYGITCVYRPPSTIVESFLNDLENYLTTVCLLQTEILMGDININLLSENSVDTNNYLSLLMSHGFYSLITGPTRLTNTSKTCIDHIFLKRNFLADKNSYLSFILDTDITDHFPVLLNFSKKVEDVKPGNIANNTIFKTIKILDKEKAKSLFIQQNWHNSVSDINDVEIATNNLYNIIENIIQRSEDTKVIKEKLIKKIKPWITSAIICSIKNRDKMKKKLLKTYSLVKEQEYKTYRNSLNKIINRCKNDYYKVIIEKAKNNMGKMYKVINKATNQITTKGKDTIKIKNNNEDFSNDKDMATYCNEYFINVGVNMLNKIKTPSNQLKINHNCVSSMFLMPTNKNEIIKHIFSLKNNSAPGIDTITTKFIKDFHIYLIEPLVHITNLIFKTGIVPTQFKISIVTPIYKSGDKSEIGNYRPISIINSFAKIFEKCLKDRLINYLEINDILTPNQFGFIGGLSTSDAVGELTRQVNESFDKNRKCLAVFLDLAKAFDTVPHDLLLETLESYGIRGPVIEIFASYLSERKQFLKINNEISEPSYIKIGIPQGTVIGPILFITYINALTMLNIDNGSLISYADDTVAVFHGISWEDTKKSAELGLAVLKNWLDSFKLSLNLQKSNYIGFSITAANRPTFHQIKLGSVDIKEVPFTKYLGIIVDKHLRWDQHILKLAQNVRKLIYRFYILRNILNGNLLILIYRSLVESILRYGVTVWGGLYKHSLKQLNVVQNFILKVIHKKTKRFPTQQLYSENIFNIRSIYILSACIHTHKLNNLNYVNHSYMTRNNVNRHLKIPNMKKSIGHRCLGYLAPKFYNILPNNLKKITNIKKFSKSCRKFIFLNIEKFNFFL